MKTYKIISSIAMGITLLTAVLSVAGIPFYGLYPAMAGLWSLPLIPIFSRRYVKKVNSRTDGSRKKSFVALTLLNGFIILVELWMAFVIVHDRILGDCC